MAPRRKVEKRSILLFSSNPDKMLVEKAWLWYTILWGGIMGFVMVSGMASHWGDEPLMGLGLLLGYGSFFFPIGYAKVVAKAYSASFLAHLASMWAGVVTLAFGLSYFQTPFFFDVLHMRYGFMVHWRIDRNPIFLYFITIAYFATYSVLGCICYRVVRSIVRQWYFPLQFILIPFIPFALAFFETLLNANPFIADLFCYDDNFFALTFGSLCYGISFVFALPVWLNTPSERRSSTPPSALQLLYKGILGNVLAVLFDTLILYLIRVYIAPRFTVVIADSSPFGGCLAKSNAALLF